MSDSATTDLTPEIQEFLKVWSASFSELLGKIAAKPFAVAVLLEGSPDVPAPTDTDLYVRAVAGGTLRGEISLRVPRTSALRLAQILMNEPADDAKEFSAEYREGCVELLRQVGGQAAAALKPTRGEVTFGIELSEPPSWPPAATAFLQGEAEAGKRLVAELQLSAAAAAALRHQDGQDAAGPKDIPANLDGLMDVELDVTLRFGSRQMLLREILELGTGAVVELDRGINEPVDLLLDGRLVARGEVVVVDGNFGLRVTELGSFLQP
jgi:flagellar motor switch protein FliN/FliY